MLTEEQRKLVEENHNLIWAYIQMRGLNPDEYYDLLAIALCWSAEKYNPEKCAFSTWVFWKFRSVVGTSYRNAHAKKRNALVISFSDPLFDDDSVSLEDTLSNGEDFTAGVDLRTMLSAINSTDREIVRLRECGLTQDEIAERLGITQVQISRRITAIKRYIKTGIYKKARRYSNDYKDIYPSKGNQDLLPL